MWSSGWSSQPDSGSGGSDRQEPLLPAEEHETGSRGFKAGARIALLLILMTGYVTFGALERVSFARMTAKLPDDVLLMHTLLTALSSALFIVLWMARSQSSSKPLSEQLQRLYPTELLQMAALDAMQTMLALDGAVAMPGMMQVLLLQAMHAVLVLVAS